MSNNQEVSCFGGNEESNSGEPELLSPAQVLFASHVSQRCAAVHFAGDSLFQRLHFVCICKNAADHWEVEIGTRFWEREKGVRLKHVDTGMVRFAALAFYVVSKVCMPFEARDAVNGKTRLFGMRLLFS